MALTDEQIRSQAMMELALGGWDGGGEFDAIVALLRELCDAPMVLVSLVESERQRFLGRAGLDATETPRSVSFCAHAMDLPDTMVVPDATLDPRFAQNALVTGDPHIRFYAGAPLVTSSGVPLGALCVIDTVPRAGLTPVQARTMRVLAANVMTILEARREVESRALIARELSHRIKNLFAVVGGLVHVSRRNDGEVDGWNALSDRLGALARASDLVVPPEHAGERETTLLRLFDTLFAPYRDVQGKRIRVEGEDVAISASAATGIALVFHEAATNAVKYGALSGPDGEVVVRVEHLADAIEIDWQERGGPDARGDGSAGGFGTRLVDSVIGRQFMGRISRDAARGGLGLRIWLPRSTIAPALN
ncbi:GAF domain-containing protein [Sphingomonas sp.]|uniref:GAF domain-containing protein n=1 Tax=Sphingomonas sp. TaxID=28214 RepID=UPI001ED30015|nr:GAF domain-containing protein [Sphingomonas sp.]MBX3595747.1 GAF domain-containing protein [Sphingomonas sp.]